MIPVQQELVDSKNGDCMRATIASLFELDIDQVPNFVKFKNHKWFTVYCSFLRSIGWSYEGYASASTKDGDITDTVNGYVYGVVWSRTYEHGTHALVIDPSGIVVHDPNPNKAFQGVNVVHSGELDGWHILKPIGENVNDN